MTISMKQDAASRIQSATAKANGGIVEKGSFATRAQSAADRNNTPVNGPSKTGNISGKN